MVTRLAGYLLGSFSRVTSPGRTYIPQLDGLRFIAIVWVVAFHLGVLLLVDFYLAQRDGVAGGRFRWDLLSLAAWTAILFWTCMGRGWVLGSPYCPNWWTKSTSASRLARARSTRC